MAKTRKCYDKENPRKKCVNKKSGKGCVEEGMGGHPGAFTDVQLSNCKIACGKKASKDSKTELAFYKDLYSRKNLPDHLESLKNFFPKYYPKENCSKGDNNYFVIENIKSDIGNDVRTLDFKIGFKTAFGFDSGTIKRKRHSILDSNLISTSLKNGYRLEGITGPNNLLKNIVINAKNDPNSGYKWTIIQRGKKKLQSSLYTLNYEYIFTKFFQNKKQVRDVAKQLNKLLDLANGSLETRGESITFIGSSILFVIGSKGGTIKLIDFAHPHWNNKKTKCCKNISPQNHGKALHNYMWGLLYLIKDFETWKEKNYNKLPEKSKNNSTKKNKSKIYRKTQKKYNKKGGDQIKHPFCNDHNKIDEKVLKYLNKKNCPVRQHALIKNLNNDQEKFLSNNLLSSSIKKNIVKNIVNNKQHENRIQINSNFIKEIIEDFCENHSNKITEALDMFESNFPNLIDKEVQSGGGSPESYLYVSFLAITLAYAVHKFTGWVFSVPEIDNNGRYTEHDFFRDEAAEHAIWKRNRNSRDAANLAINTAIFREQSPFPNDITGEIGTYF